MHVRHPPTLPLGSVVAKPIASSGSSSAPATAEPVSRATAKATGSRNRIIRRFYAQDVARGFPALPPACSQGAAQCGDDKPARLTRGRGPSPAPEVFAH
jgi:hypothetical protein